MRRPSSDPVVPARKPDPEKDPVSSYAWEVLRGRIVACRLVRLAAQRHFNDLAHGAERDIYWHPEVAVHRIAFFRFLRHSKGEWGYAGGQIFELSHWQKFVIGSVYGWLRKDGTRRFRTAYQELARKNGKTTLMAGVGVSSLVADREPGAEIYTAATRKDQARLIFDEAKRMVRASPLLSSRIAMFKNNMSIDLTASKFEPLSSDDRTLDGLNPHVILIDELHKHRTRAVLDVLDTAMGSRRQPLLWVITTAGDDAPESVYAQENDYACRVLEGTIAPADCDSHFAFITTLDAGDRWDDPKVWVKANPNLGISVKFDDLVRQANKAKLSPGALVEFKRLRLNMRTAASDRFIDMDIWARNSLRPKEMADTVYRAEMLAHLEGRPFFGGLDLSSKTDLSAWVKLYPPKLAGERWMIVGRYWMPLDKVEEKTDRDQVQYRRWIDEGWMEATPGNTVDHREIEQAVLDDSHRGQPISIAYDPWNALQLAINLDAEGLPIVEFVQGLKSYTGPTKEFEAKLLQSEFNHGDDPVLRWMAYNLTVQVDKNENMMPTKRMSRGRIDGCTATIMALGRWMHDDMIPYGDGRGLQVI